MHINCRCRTTTHAGFEELLGSCAEKAYIPRKMIAVTAEYSSFERRVSKAGTISLKSEMISSSVILDNKISPTDRRIAHLALNAHHSVVTKSCTKQHCLSLN